MAYKSCVLDSLYAIRWGREPELGDVERYASEISAAHAKQRRPPVGLFIMPQDSQIPSETFRKAQAARLPEILADLEFAVAVFEGGGFKQAVMRGALGAILLLAPKRFAIHVRSTVEEALVDSPPKPLRFNGRLAISELKRLGIVADPGP